ncbi:hypothetical protein CHARACLAT_026185 [Characodon lateralis]|uniref:Uncharacterized protein n=1 Tax=Characodon lateralis TaxID=208331 RepID=A0ABU7EP52_9TELE|nr:hypothetical protein [Characodon lateralis]
MPEGIIQSEKGKYGEHYQDTSLQLQMFCLTHNISHFKSKGSSEVTGVKVQAKSKVFYDFIKSSKAIKFVTPV